MKIQEWVMTIPLIQMVQVLLLIWNLLMILMKPVVTMYMVFTTVLHLKLRQLILRRMVLLLSRMGILADHISLMQVTLLRVTS